MRIFAIDLDQLSVEIREKMAKESKDDKLLDELAKDSNLKVLCAVAENLSTSKDTLEELARFPNLEVLCAVMQNPNTNKDTLDEFSKSKQENLRISVAQNIKLKKSTIERLSNDPSSTVKFFVATTPYEEEHQNVLLKLAKDPDEYVRQSLIQYGLIQKKNINNIEQILQIMMNDQNDLIKKMVADRTRDPQKLSKLSNDKEWVVRAAVIANRATEFNVIESMKDDPNGTCRNIVYQLLTFGRIIPFAD